MSLTDWVGCSGWGQVRHPCPCSVSGGPWCRMVGGDASLEEAPSPDYKILDREFGTYPLGRDRFVLMSGILSLMITIKTDADSL